MSRVARQLSGLIGMIGVLLVTTNLAAEPQRPAQLVMQLTNILRGVVSPPTAGTSTNGAEAHWTDSMFDVAGVGQWVIGKHWHTCTVTEQQQFIGLLHDYLGRVAYPQATAFFRDLEVRIVGEQIQAHQATVHTTLTHPTEGLMQVDYRLVQQRNRWWIRDIIFDGISLTLNFRAKVHQLIQTQSCGELVQRLQEHRPQTSAPRSHDEASQFYFE